MNLHIHYLCIMDGECTSSIRNARCFTKGNKILQADWVELAVHFRTAFFGWQSLCGPRIPAWTCCGHGNFRHQSGRALSLHQLLTDEGANRYAHHLEIVLQASKPWREKVACFFAFSLYLPTFLQSPLFDATLKTPMLFSIHQNPTSQVKPKNQSLKPILPILHSADQIPKSFTANLHEGFLFWPLDPKHQALNPKPHPCCIGRWNLDKYSLACSPWVMYLQERYI